eukprot:scaffold5714_cov161-Ochromonas_danica.AAC.5
MRFIISFVKVALLSYSLVVTAVRIFEVSELIVLRVVRGQDWIAPTNKKEDSFEEILFDNEEIVSLLVLEKEDLTESSSAAQGWVYYNFYGSTNCSEEVTYSTGVPDNVCLSADILAGKVTQRKLTSSFSAFKLVNQNNNNTDKQCTTVYNSRSLNSTFQNCRSASAAFDIDVSNMLSVQGFCSAASDPPLSSSSYVYSNFVGSDSCSSNALSQYKAYTLDSCFGTNEGTSTLYSFSDSHPDQVSMTSYYGSTCSATQNFESTIPLGCSNTTTKSSVTSHQTSVYPPPDDSSDSNRLSGAARAGISVVVAVGGSFLIYGTAYLLFHQSAVAGAAAAGAVH